MVLVTDQTRVAVWDTLCDLEWNERYYLEMAKQRQQIHRILRYAIVGGVFADGALFYAGTIHAWLFFVALFGGVVVAVLTIWDALSNHAEEAAMMRLTAYACDDLSREIERLWRDIESGAISNDDAEARHKSITDRWATATQRTMPEGGRSLLLKTSRESNLDIENLKKSHSAV